MQCLVGIRDEGDEDREDDVDEQSYEDVEVDFGEDPGSLGRLRHHGVRVEHVVTVDQ